MISFDQLGAIYGFNAGTELHIPDVDTTDLWREITGYTSYHSTTAKHTDVKHPVLRMFLKILSSTLLCKSEPGKMRLSELTLLHYTIGHMFDYCEPGADDHNIHFGSVFAHHLEGLKEKGTKGKRPKEYIGSLLTPIFTHCCINIGNATVIDTPGIFDETRLKMGHFLGGNWGNFYYKFHDYRGEPRMITLPNRHCQIDFAEELNFDVPPEDSLPQRNTTRSRRHTRPASPPPRAQPGFSDFPMPPVGSYETDPYRNWLTGTLKRIWDRLNTLPRCCHRDDIARQAHTATQSPRRSARADEEMPDVSEDDVSSGGS